MEYKFEHTIRLTDEIEYKNLYSWCLNEFDENEKKSADLIPFDWSLYFTASSLSVNRSIGIRVKRNENYEKLDSSESNSTTVICGTLHSGTVENGTHLVDDVNYSMFGTSRKIKNFDLRIHQAENDREICRVTGVPSYDYEMDFRNKTANDFVLFDVFIEKIKFDTLVKLIESKKIESTYVRLGHVDGFYSEWSPSISTDYIKILTRGNVVENKQELKFNYPIVGNVEEFDIYLKSHSDLSLKKSFQPLDIDKTFDENKLNDDYDQKSDVVFSDQNKHEIEVNKLAQISLIKSIIGKFKLPIWLILFALLILILK